MSVVLDTHMWVWWLLGAKELTVKERESLDQLAQAKTPPVLPAVCLWEVQMLHANGRLRLDPSFERWVRDATHPAVVAIAALSVEVVIAVDSLPETFHGDPVDRLIVATARALRLPLATRDKSIRSSRTVSLWKP